MNQSILTARIRHEKGKGAARRLINNNEVPAIFYGPDTKSIMLTLDAIDIENLLLDSDAGNKIIDLQIKSDQGTDTHKVMIKDLSIDPLKNICLHLDFYQISMDKQITAFIPIHLKNIPIGVSQEQGILQQIRRKITVSCLPGQLISSLEIDVSNLAIGDTIHIRDLELPSGISLTEGGHLTIATVAAPKIKEDIKEEEDIEETEEPESDNEA